MRQHHKTCRECNAPFTSKRSDAKYCSGACKQFYCLKNRGYIRPNIDQVLAENNLLKRCINAYIELEPAVDLYFPINLKNSFKALNKEIKKSIENSGSGSI